MKSISIMGDRWKLVVFDHETFVSKFGEGMAAFTDPKYKQIFFNADDLDQETVRHELTHAYISYLCLDAANIDNHNLEEIFCELVGKYGPKLIKQAEEAFKKLRSME